MKKIIVVLFAVWPVAVGLGQGNAPAASPAAAADMEALRQQVQALTETVKALQQQVKDQQTALDRVNGAAASEKESASAEPTSSPEPSAAPQFPTEDRSVVESAPASEKPGPSTEASSGAFPTTDTSVVASTTPESGLTAPITIGGGKNYMNISFDAIVRARLLERQASRSTRSGRSRSAAARIQRAQHRARVRWRGRSLLRRLRQHRFQARQRQRDRGRSRGSVSADDESAVQSCSSKADNSSPRSAGSIRPIRTPGILPTAPLVHGRLLGPDGLRGVGAQISWTAAGAVVFAVDSRRAKRTRRHRLFVSQSRRQRNLLRPDDDRSRDARRSTIFSGSRAGKTRST